MERRRFLEGPSLKEDALSYWVIFDENNPSTELEGGGNDEVRKRLRSKFKRCMAMPQTGGKAAIAYLSEDNSSLWPDRSTAPLDEYIKGYNVMVHFPRYYYRNEDLGNNRYKLYISDVKVNDDYKEERECLIGVFEACEDPSSSSLCSWYNFISSANKPISTFYANAQLNGSKWGLIDYRAHKTIANMFCIMYGNTDISTDNSSIPCSGGTKHYNEGKTGGTITLGNLDGKRTTLGATSYYSTSFLGLEDCYYGKWEFVQGVNIINCNWIVYDGGLSVDKNASQLTSEGFTNVRSAGTGGFSSGYITKINHGEYADIVPTGAGGSDTIYYADYYWYGFSNRILLRSGDSSHGAIGGVFVSNASNDSSYLNADVGSRLAFYGTIEVKTKDEWLALTPDFAG